MPPNSASLRPSKVFVQFVNPELLTLYGWQGNERQLLAKAIELSRLALLVAEDGLVFPRSYLVEVAVIDRLLEYLTRARAAGLLAVASESPDALEFLAKKRREYRGVHTLFGGYGEDADAVQLDAELWTPRTASSSGEIRATWLDELEGRGLWQQVLQAGSLPYLNRNLSRLENAIERVPDRLYGRAFIYRHLEGLLPIDLTVSQRVAVEMLISRAYLLSYMNEYNAAILVDGPCGQLDCGISQKLDGHEAVSVRKLNELLSLLGISGHLRRSMSLQALLRLRNEPLWRWLMERHFEDVSHQHRPLMGAMMAAGFRGLDPPQSKGVDAVLGQIAELQVKIAGVLPDQLELGSEVRPASTTPSKRRLKLEPTMELEPSPNDIFLVHGREARAVDGLKSLLRAANLVPVEWEEARSWTGKPTPFTLEVLQAAFPRVGAVVVLFTPDDEVKLREDLLRDGDPQHERASAHQARPNVLVEAGMALALKPEKTVIVEIGVGMRPISDLDGLNVVRFDGGPQSRANLIRRLTDCGCKPRGDDYLTAGDFAHLAATEP